MMVHRAMDVCVCVTRQ